MLGDAIIKNRQELYPDKYNPGVPGEKDDGSIDIPPSALATVWKWKLPFDKDLKNAPAWLRLKEFFQELWKLITCQWVDD